MEEEEKEKKNLPPTPIEEFNDNLKEYLATRYELTVLKASQKAAVVGSAAAFGAVIGILVVMFLLFIFIAAGFYLSDWLGSYGHGFAVLSGIFLVAAVIIYFGRKKFIMTPVRNSLIKAMFDED